MDEKFESLVDMDQIVKQNEARRKEQLALAKAKEERITQTLYQESIKMQESLKHLQAQLGNFNFDIFLASGASQNMLPNSETAEGFEKSKKELPSIQKTASSRSLKKKVVIEDGEPKNYHVDYTGKMIYYENQK